MTMLFEDDRGGDTCLETMRGVSFHDLPKRSHCAATAFPVIRHFGQPSLNLRRRAETLNQVPFLSRERFAHRWRVHGMEVTQSLKLCKLCFRAPRFHSHPL